jgi:hypothetical protein
MGIELPSLGNFRVELEVFVLPIGQALGALAAVTSGLSKLFCRVENPAKHPGNGFCRFESPSNLS